MTNERLAIVTCSYAPDLARCRRLCESVDRHVPAEVTHTLIVPARDMASFACLQTPRRRVVAVQDVLPGRWWQLPLGQRWWVGSAGMPVRGWIMQQLTKLSADHVTDAEFLLFADSDLQFIRNFDPAAVCRDGALRLHRVPGAMDHGIHLTWHHRAATLLGLPRTYAGSDYVGQLITWRRSRLQGLKAHIESLHGRSWSSMVASSLRFSEYILYGAYVEHVLGDLGTGHYAEQEDLCHCCWFAEDVDSLMAGHDRLNSRALALLLQSNLNLSPATEALITRAAGRSLATNVWSVPA